MADEGEAPTLFEDEPSAQPESEEQTSPIFGETTEISLDSDDTKKDEAEVVKEEPKTEQKDEDLAKPEVSASSPSSSTDDTTKPEDEGEKPETSTRTKLEVCILYCEFFQTLHILIFFAGVSSRH